MFSLCPVSFADSRVCMFSGCVSCGSLSLYGGSLGVCFSTRTGSQSDRGGLSLSAPLLSKKMALASVNVAAQVLAQTCSGMVWALSPNGKQRLRITERQASSRLVPGSCEADPGSRAESQPYGSLVRGFVCSCLGPPPGRGFL